MQQLRIRKYMSFMVFAEQQLNNSFTDDTSTLTENIQGK